jgi:Tripartite tricarboxylate transporter family receptor
MKIARQVILGTAMALAAFGRASAQDWPTRNVTVVVPIPAGVASDIIARVVFEQVGRQVGQTFVIENRPGAGGTIGANMVAKAAPDGQYCSKPLTCSSPIRYPAALWLGAADAVRSAEETRVHHAARRRGSGLRLARRCRQGLGTLGCHVTGAVRRGRCLWRVGGELTNPTPQKGDEHAA